MTRFVPNFSTDQLLPPWVSKGARNWVFALKVKPKNLQNFVDTHFNCGAPDVAPYYYKPFDYPYGLLRVTKHDDFSSSHGGIEGTQTLRKIDVNWSYPVNRWRVSSGNVCYDRQTVWVEPMAFDNNSYTMFSSREIWGTEANMARIALEEETNPSRMHIDVAMQGLKTFTPKSISHLIGVLHIEMDPEEKTDLMTAFEKHPGLAEFTAILFSSINVGGNGGDTSSGNKPQVPKDYNHNSEVNTLKQFRDVFNMQVAVYRAIIASRTEQTNVRKMHFYNGSKVKLDFMWSQTMAEALNDFFDVHHDLDGKQLLGHPGGSHEIDGKKVDWDLDRIAKEVVLAASFTSDILYDVTGTLHTYGS